MKGVLIIWAFIIGFLVGIKVSDSASIVKEQAIKNNCAQYNPITGSFEWIEKEKAE